MQLEIRNAVERDRIVYNGLGLLFGAIIAVIFFRRVSLMVIAALPPVLAVLWSLGLFGWLGFKLNLFFNVMIAADHGDGLRRLHAATVAIRNPPARRRHRSRRRGCRPRGRAGVRARARHRLAFIRRAALLAICPDPHVRHCGRMPFCISFVAVMLVLPLMGTFLMPQRGQAGEGPLARRRADGQSRQAGGVDRRPGGALAVRDHDGGTDLVPAPRLGLHQLEPRYRLADQVPDREQALGATAQIDQKLTGANPVHVMIEWKSGASLYSAGPMEVVAKAHEVLEKEAGLGNVWSLESLRRWLKEAGDDRPETVQKFVGYLPEHLVRRFIAKEGDAVLVTGRLPDVDSSRILPVVEKIDRALDGVRKQHPDFRISVTGLPAVAARNSARMISQLNEALPLCVAFAAILLAIAFRSVFVGFVSLLPGLYPVVASGAILWAMGGGLEFASVVALLVVFGLAIDALIHFFNRLSLEERKEPRADLAIRNARVLVGPAIILTTLVLAFGLGVTVFSDLPSLRMFGFVCGTTLVASLLADLVFLPALIMLVRKVWKHKVVG